MCNEDYRPELEDELFVVKPELAAEREELAKAVQGKPAIVGRVYPRELSPVAESARASALEALAQ